MSLEINNEIIEDEILVEEFNYVKENYQAHADKEIPNNDDLMILVKENIIRRCLLRQEVESQDIFIEDDILEKEISIMNSFRTDGNVEEDEVKKHALLKCKIDKLLDDVSKDIGDPQEKHLKQFFSDNRDYYDGLQQVELDQIVKSFENEEKKKLIIKKLDVIKKDIDTGKITFHEAVEQYSDVKDNNGYLGYLEINLMGEKLKGLVKNLKVNEVTEPYVESNCIYLFKLLSKKEITSDNFSSIKEQIKDDLLSELKEKKIDIYITKLMEKSEIIDNKTI